MILIRRGATELATTIFSAQFEPASVQILKDPRLPDWIGLKVEAWLFEDGPARESLAAGLRQFGMHADVRSAYKPLLHYFLEQAPRSGMRAVVIEYPRHPHAVDSRFLSEAYPLADLAAQGSPAQNALQWRAFAPSADVPCYRVTWADARGKADCEDVLAPNVVRPDALGRDCLVPCGYLRVTDPQSGRVLVDEVIETEIDRLFRATMDVLCAHPWGREEPYFERLEIRADIPGAEIVGNDGRLIASTLEALHEDLYFSALEFFQYQSGRPPGDRGLQPGQIVPDVRQAMPGGPATVRVIVHPTGSPVPALEPVTYIDVPRGAEDSGDGVAVRSAGEAPLADLTGPIDASRVRDEVAALAGTHFAFQSRQSRTLTGVVHTGTLPPIVVTGGQHANEASGVVGALRGTEWLAAQPGAHFACVPLENPDGYALFAQYRAIHPQHMHHAARYTALGDDLEYREREPWYERAGRIHALAVTGAQLHLSLHGYPAHEWTRPLTGYLPRGFELWSVPKGYFLILRYRPGWEAVARQFLEELTLALAEVPGLIDFNARQLNTYETHAGERPFEVIHGIACIVSQNDRQTPGVVLVTEFPDETIAGADFVFAHEVQTRTVRLAATIWWDLAPVQP